MADLNSIMTSRKSQHIGALVNLKTQATPTAAPLSHADQFEQKKQQILTGLATGKLNEFNVAAKSLRIAEHTAAQVTVTVSINERQYSPSELPDRFSLELLPEKLREKFFESEHYKLSYAPWIKLLGTGVARVVPMPVPELLRDSEAHAAISLYPESYIYPELFDDFSEGVSVFHIMHTRGSGEPVTRELCEAARQKLAMIVNNGHNFERQNYHVGIYRGRLKLDNPLESYFVIVSAGVPSAMRACLEEMIKSRDGPAGPVRWDATLKKFSASGRPMTSREFARSDVHVLLAREGRTKRFELAKQTAEALGVDIQEFCDVCRNTIAFKTVVGGTKELRCFYYKNCVDAEQVHNGFVLALSPLHGYCLIPGAPTDLATSQYVSFGSRFSNPFQSALPVGAGRSVVRQRLTTLLRSDFISAYKGTRIVGGHTLTDTDLDTLVPLADAASAERILKQIIVVGQSQNKKTKPTDVLPLDFGAFRDTTTTFNIMLSKLVPHNALPVTLTPELVIIATPRVSAEDAFPAAFNEQTAPASDLVSDIPLVGEIKEEKRVLTEAELRAKIIQEVRQTLGAEYQRKLEEKLANPAPITSVSAVYPVISSAPPLEQPASLEGQPNVASEKFQATATETATASFTSPFG